MLLVIVLMMLNDDRLMLDHADDVKLMADVKVIRYKHVVLVFF